MGGVPVCFGNPRSTSKLCPRCRGRLLEDRHRRREVWCGICKKWQDRDVVAAMNISYKGLVRLTNPQGSAYEAMRGNPISDSQQELVILRVDALKISELIL